MEKTIRMSFELSGGKEGIVPEGIKYKLIIDVKTGFAFFKFDRVPYTKAFYLSQKKEGKECKYEERLQCCIVKYPNMTQQQIIDDISASIKSREKKK